MVNKIISMSVWGDNPRYIEGARRQVELAKEFYPDWKVRIYIDDKSKLADLDAELVEVTDGSYGMFWRFEPMFEDENNIVMVRDSDSRITIREQMAINEWLQSDKKFHTFKDHEAHYQFKIIGCAFAFKGKFPKEVHDKMQDYVKRMGVYVGDQIFLQEVIWPLVENDAMVHSMMDDGWFKDTRKRLKNKFSFCGNGYSEKDLPLYPSRFKDFANWDPTNVSEETKFDKGVMIELKGIL